MTEETEPRIPTIDFPRLRRDLDGLQCVSCPTNKGPHKHDELYLNSACHTGRPVVVSFHEGVFWVSCIVCDELVTAIRPAPRHVANLSALPTTCGDPNCTREHALTVRGCRRHKLGLVITYRDGALSFNCKQCRGHVGCFEVATEHPT